MGVEPIQLPEDDNRTTCRTIQQIAVLLLPYHQYNLSMDLYFAVFFIHNEKQLPDLLFLASPHYLDPAPIA